MRCKKCGIEMEWNGFSREMIMRGKDKGQYIVTTFYKCPVCSLKRSEK